ncbi:hypothetical protein BpHYR1_022896 [Brachionus plicatilis]|uniref:Uncharacterized protein n=1 Tax=Brachionus plicatilis TaxID=10195 RepID=A0A3M7R668_BRAPC|nr:hypothetical protein BpHYR1_022896 [Brachionus plicatilis]
MLSINLSRISFLSRVRILHKLGLNHSVLLVLIFQIDQHKLQLLRQEFGSEDLISPQNGVKYLHNADSSVQSGFNVLQMPHVKGQISLVREPITIVSQPDGPKSWPMYKSQKLVETSSHAFSHLIPLKPLSQLQT